MRRWIAWVAASFLLLHTVLAAPLAPPCCVGECPAQAMCAEGSCAGCAPVAAPAPAAQRVAVDPAPGPRGRPALALPEPDRVVWRPPG